MLQLKTKNEKRRNSLKSFQYEIQKLKHLFYYFFFKQQHTHTLTTCDLKSNTFS